MNQDRELQERTVEEILSYTGGDPFAGVIEASEQHRNAHGDVCGLYPAGPFVMRLATTVARAAGATKILDLGCGVGYSTLWFASECSPNAQVVGVDRFLDHITAAKRIAEDHGLAERCSFVVGEAVEVLPSLSTPVDLIHDDAWFAEEPTHLEQAISMLRIGGTMTMPNWFLLADAITGSPGRDWSAFAGPNWARAVRAYARRLGEDSRLKITWSVTPPLGIAVRVR